MLTPHANDPNRKSELERKNRQPHTFGLGPNLPKVPEKKDKPNK